MCLIDEMCDESGDKNGDDTKDCVPQGKVNYAGTFPLQGVVTYKLPIQKHLRPRPRIVISVSHPRSLIVYRSLPKLLFTRLVDISCSVEHMKTTFIACFQLILVTFNNARMVLTYNK